MEEEKKKTTFLFVFSAYLPMFLLKFHYYISIQNLMVASDGAWIFSFKPTKNHKDFFFCKCGHTRRLSDGYCHNRRLTDGALVKKVIQKTKEKAKVFFFVNVATHVG